MKFIIKILGIFIFGFSVGIIFSFASKQVVDYIPRIANILSWQKIDENIKKTSKKKFFGEIKKEKIGQYMKVLREKGYKTYYSSFLTNSGIFIENDKTNKPKGGNQVITGTLSGKFFFPNLGNISLSKNILNYFIGKNFEDIKRQEWEALAFYMGLKKQYSNKIISIQEKFKHNKQKLSLSCEANTLTDFVNYYRIKNGVYTVKESRLIGQIPKDTKTFTTIDGINYRGDPEVGFVGKMNGYAFRSDFKYTSKRGWGVYPKPLLKILNYYLSKFGLQAIEKNKLTELDIISSLAVKNPIMMRYIYDNKTIPLKITTSTNRKTTLYKNQHVGLIVGTKLDDNMHIEGVFYYDGLHYNKQFMKYKDFQEQTKLLSKFIMVEKYR